MEIFRHKNEINDLWKEIKDLCKRVEALTTERDKLYERVLSLNTDFNFIMTELDKYYPGVSDHVRKYLKLDEEKKNDIRRKTP